jgi:Fe-S-cluster-containing hydrogenase component 2
MVTSKIKTAAENCYGCRMCELVCSFHHQGAFCPEASSIKISRDYLQGEIGLAIDSTCDFCEREGRPLCVKHCIYGALEVDIK